MNDYHQRSLTLMITVGVALASLAGCGKEDASSEQSDANDTSVIVLDDMGSETDAAPDVDQGEEPDSTEDMGATPEDDMTPEQPVGDITYIHLEGDAISVEGDITAVTVDGTTATITAPGTYRIDGTLEDGAIAVQSPEDGDVRIQLDGVNITHSDGSPLHILEADDVIIELLEGTDNKLEDGAEYTFPTPEDDEPNATLFSKDDLALEGKGNLSIVANYNDGLASKDDLELNIEGTLTITAVDDAIRGKDSITITSGKFIIDAGGDGLKSDEDEDEEKGFIQIDGGDFDLTTASDGIQAERVITITGGSFSIEAGGGNAAQLGEDDSAKGLKGLAEVHITGGTFVLDTADDAIHSDQNITIEGGDFEISSGDDGIHADTRARIIEGTITVSKAYEGIESEEVIIDGGRVHVTTSDDGLNGAGGESSPGGFGGPGGPGGSGSSYQLTINGGYIVIDALGDGVDANGNIDMTGGTVIVHGPSTNMNGALDYDSNFSMTGGLLIATGSSRMAQAPSASGTTQPAVLINLTSSRQAGELFHIAGPGDENVLTFAPLKTYQSVAFSSPDLELGVTYTYFAGGSSTGTPEDGLYADGTYSPGTQLGTLTTNSTITTVGSGGGRP